MVVVEASFDRVAPADLRQTDRDILGPVDVQPPGVPLIGWCRVEAVTPPEYRRQIQRRAVPERRFDVLHDLIGVIPLIDDARIRIEQWEARHALETVRRRVHQNAVFVPSCQLVPDEPVGALEVRRRVHRVVHRHRVVRDVGIREEDVRNQSGRDQNPLTLARVFAGQPQVRRHLVVDAHGGLLHEVRDRRQRSISVAADLVVVGRVDVLDLVGQRIPVEQRQAQGILTVRRNPADNAAGLETARRVGRVTW